MATEGEGTVPSVARVLHASEQRDLREIALGLPSDWCVLVEPPYGQLRVLPLDGRPMYHRTWVAARRWGRIRHEDVLKLW